MSNKSFLIENFYDVVKTQGKSGRGNFQEKQVM